MTGALLLAAALAAAAGGAAKPPSAVKPRLPIHAIIHPGARRWKPASLIAGGDPKTAANRVVLRQERVKGADKGTPSAAKAHVRLLKSGEDRWLVVSVFPAALEKRRAHFEIRFRLVKGSVEEAQAVLVTVVDRHYLGWGLDADELRANGLEFSEDVPGSGQIQVSALDPRPSKTALNAGFLKRAAFADWYAGVADVSWKSKGVAAPK